MHVIYHTQLAKDGYTLPSVMSRDTASLIFFFIRKMKIVDINVRRDIARHYSNIVISSNVDIIYEKFCIPPTTSARSTKILLIFEINTLLFIMFQAFP